MFWEQVLAGPECRGILYFRLRWCHSGSYNCGPTRSSFRVSRKAFYDRFASRFWGCVRWIAVFRGDFQMRRQQMDEHGPWNMLQLL